MAVTSEHFRAAREADRERAATAGRACSDMCGNGVSGEISKGVTATPSRNGPPVGRTLLGEPLNLETMPALVKGRCNFCGKKLRPGQVKLCSEFCRREWRKLLMVEGPKVMERLLHATLRRRSRSIWTRGFREMNRLAFHTWGRLKETRKHYGWGQDD